MTFLRHAIAQLADSEREHPRLFQFTVEFTELLCKLLALFGDIGAFGRRILGGRGTELLQPFLRLPDAGLEFVDRRAQHLRCRVESLSEPSEPFRRDVLAV